MVQTTKEEFFKNEQGLLMVLWGGIVHGGHDIALHLKVQLLKCPNLVGPGPQGRMTTKVKPHVGSDNDNETRRGSDVLNQAEGQIDILSQTGGQIDIFSWARRQIDVLSRVGSG